MKNPSIRLAQHRCQVYIGIEKTEEEERMGGMGLEGAGTIVLAGPFFPLFFPTSNFLHG